MPPAGTCSGGGPGRVPWGSQPLGGDTACVTAATPRIYTVLVLPPPAKAVTAALTSHRGVGTPLIHLPPRTEILLQLFLLQTWLEVAEELK